MAKRESWAEVRERRMAEPGSAEATRLAFELGAAVRELRPRAGGARRSWPRQPG